MTTLIGVDFRIGTDRRCPSMEEGPEDRTDGTERSTGLRLGLRGVVVRFGVLTAGVLGDFGVGVRTVVVGAAVPLSSASGSIEPA
jgi:hypothetical protein